MPVIKLSEAVRLDCPFATKKCNASSCMSWVMEEDYNGIQGYCSLIDSNAKSIKDLNTRITILINKLVSVGDGIHKVLSAGLKEIL